VKKSFPPGKFFSFFSHFLTPPPWGSPHERFSDSDFVGFFFAPIPIPSFLVGFPCRFSFSDVPFLFPLTCFLPQAVFAHF